MMRAIRWTSVSAILLASSTIVLADEAKGTIKNVDTGRSEVVLKGVVKDSIYELNKGSMVWLDGFRCKLGDLTAEDRAVVIFNKTGDHMIASSVRGLRKAQETTGTVNDVFNEKQQVTLKGTLKNTTYDLTKAATVWIDGKRGKLNDIRAGDQVLVTYEQRGDHYMANDVTVLKRRQ
jgi:hypothetical protein